MCRGEEDVEDVEDLRTWMTVELMDIWYAGVAVLC